MVTSKNSRNKRGIKLHELIEQILKEEIEAKKAWKTRKAKEVKRNE